MKTKLLVVFLVTSIVQSLFASSIQVRARQLDENCFKENKAQSDIGLLFIDKKLRRQFTQDVKVVYEIVKKDGTIISSGEKNLNLISKDGSAYSTSFKMERDLSEHIFKFYFRIHPEGSQPYYVDRGAEIDFYESNYFESDYGLIPRGHNLMKEVTPSYEKFDHRQDEGFSLAPYLLVNLPKASCDEKVTRQKIFHKLLN